MQRRHFLQSTLAAGLASTAVTAVAAEGPASQSTAGSPVRQFKLKYAPHFGMFAKTAGNDLLDQLQFMHDQGFTALEDNRMKQRPVEEQAKIARRMSQLGMQMGVFVAAADFKNPTFTSGDKNYQEQVLAEIKESVDVAKRVNARWCTVVPGAFDPKLELDYQTANCIDLLKRCAEIFEPHGIVMVLEPLNHWANHPGAFLHKIPQAYLICKAVNSPSCKILFDMYHQQITEGNIIPNIDRAWDEVAYFQVGDTPGRKEPGTGEMNYLNIFRHIHAKGYTGIVGMEHGNSRPGVEGEQAVIDAYVQSDNF